MALFPFYGDKDMTQGMGEKKARKKSYPPRSWASWSVVVSVNWLSVCDRDIDLARSRMFGGNKMSQLENERGRGARASSSASPPLGTSSECKQVCQSWRAGKGSSVYTRRVRGQKSR